MIYQPPVGARDLLPLDVAQKRWIEDRLEQGFQRWGYHRIITSTVEYLETLMAGGAIDRSTVIELQGSGSQRLGLRPELTASVARAVVTRLATVTYPQRLYYSANVFRQSPQGSHGGQQEYYQAGVELLGAASGTADAEILLLLTDCLNLLGLSESQIILGEAGLTQSLLSVFDPTVRQAVRSAIATLDPLALETLDLSDDLRQRAMLLMDLRGRPEDVLQQVGQLNLNPAQQAIVNRLKSLIDTLRAAGATGADRVILDLSLIQSFDYYTGIVFEVVGHSDAGYQVLGQGGRYDHLLGVFHPQGKTFPGIGFSLNLETLHQLLLTSAQLPAASPRSDWLVVPTVPQATAAAFAQAQKIREAAALVRVEVELDPDRSPEEIRAIARRRNIDRIAWISAEGLPEIEALTEPGNL
jgi:ATP phosphoribosyltransferase regulatory subunit